MDEDKQAIAEEKRFINLVEGEGGQFSVESNIDDWPTKLKLLVASMRDTEVRKALGL